MRYEEGRARHFYYRLHVDAPWRIHRASQTHRWVRVQVSIRVSFTLLSTYFLSFIFFRLHYIYLLTTKGFQHSHRWTMDDGGDTRRSNFSCQITKHAGDFARLLTLPLTITIPSVVQGKSSRLLVVGRIISTMNINLKGTLSMSKK